MNQIREEFVELLENLEISILKNTEEELIVGSHYDNKIEYKWVKIVDLYNILFESYKKKYDDSVSHIEALAMVATVTNESLKTMDENTLMSAMSNAVGFKLESKQEPISKEQFKQFLKEQFLKNLPPENQ